MRHRWLAVGVVLAISVIVLGAGGRSGRALPREADRSAGGPGRVDPGLYQEGRYVYEQNCLICHGRWGDGRGEMSAGMWPRPRKFSSGIFKYRSTPSGSLPTDADLERTIRGGLFGTSMPTFQHLSDREVSAVIAYVKSFSKRWDQADRYAPPLELPSPPDWMDQPAERTRHMEQGKVFFVANCAPCHGPGGKGDGPAAAGLEDDWGQRAPPTDLTQASVRSGPGLRDLYRVLVTGLDGTPMPSFREATSEEDRWNLVAYLESLRNRPDAK
jgi:cytochrome c oxidase cbb3-type subunit 2